jgi:hypothetical protein
MAPKDNKNPRVQSENHTNQTIDANSPVADGKKVLNTKVKKPITSTSVKVKAKEAEDTQKDTITEKEGMITKEQLDTIQAKSIGKNGYSTEVNKKPNKIDDAKKIKNITPIKKDDNKKDEKAEVKKTETKKDTKVVEKKTTNEQATKKKEDLNKKEEAKKPIPAKTNDKPVVSSKQAPSKINTKSTFLLNLATTTKVENIKQAKVSENPTPDNIVLGNILSDSNFEENKTMKDIYNHEGDDLDHKVIPDLDKSIEFNNTEGRYSKNEHEKEIHHIEKSLFDNFTEKVNLESHDEESEDEGEEHEEENIEIEAIENLND